MPVGKIYWLERGMLGAELENVDQNGDGTIDFVRFTIKSSFIHAVHPIGFIRKLEVTVDGKEIPTDDLFFVIRKNWIPVRYVPTISDIWWNTGEYAHIYMKRSGGLPVGEHEVSCRMEFSSLFNTRTVDYDDFSRHMPMTLSKTMTVGEKAI